MKLLDGREKEIFQTFSDAQEKLSSVSIADSFVEGFCIGMGMTVDVMSKKL